MPCVQCCRCQSSEVVRSRWRFNAADLWTAATFRRPYRCTACLHRFAGWNATGANPPRPRTRWRKPTTLFNTASLAMLLCWAILATEPSRADVVISNMNANPTNGTALSTNTGGNSNRITFTPGQQGLFRLILDIKIFNNSNATSDRINSAILNFNSVGTIGSSVVLGTVASNATNIGKKSFGTLQFDLGEIDLGAGGAEIVFSLASLTGGISAANTFWAAGGSSYYSASSAYPGWVTASNPPTASINGGPAEGYQWELQAVHAPEPGTLLLGLIASSAGGGAVWWKRRKKSQAPSADNPDEPTIA